MSQVFISHSSRDNAIAHEIGERLRLQGHRELFLDFDPETGIPAGRDWEREIYRQLRACRAVLVLCSEYSMSSNWCFAEIAFAKSLGKDVFPIRVQPCWCAKQPCTCINPILTSKQIVDLTGEREAAYQRIWRGLREAGLDPADMFEWDGDRAPYPGLNAFQEEDCAVFFGREKDIRDGLDSLNRMQRLGAGRALIVLGSSGSGKSSLVRAGLLPRLRRSADRWLVLPTLRPQGAPIRELAIALAAAFKDAGAPRDWREIRDNLSQAVAASPPKAEVLVELAVELLVESGKREASILITIDQTEELLAGDQESRAFLDFLSAALDQPHSRMVAVFTLRSDFLGNFQQTGIGQALEFADLRVGPLPPDQLIEVIEGPARVAGLELEPALVQSLIRDADTEDALPLLAFTLRELYERGGGDGRLEMREYRDELGGLEGSLARVAESVFRDNADSAGLEAELRAAFLSMVRLNDDGQYSRRPANWHELPGPVRPLLERFISARLLVTRDAAGERIVEVAHEALFRAWDRLKEWLDENRADLFRRELLHRAARDWSDGARAPELLVHRGGRLEEAERLFSNPAFVFDETEKSYFQSCLDARAADRESRRTMADTARVAIASDWLSRDPTTAALILSEVEQPDRTLFAVQRMIEVLNHRFAEVELRGHTSPVRYASFSPRGDLVVTAGEDHTARIWRSDGLGQPVVLAGHTQMLRVAVFSPDGERVLTASDDGTARVWRVDGTGEPVVLAGHSDGLMTAAFDPTGERVVTASRDKTARVWSADGSGSPLVLQGHEGLITVGRFSPGGDRVLTASFDCTARVWPIDGRQDPLIFPHKRSVLVADFCPRGQRIVTGTMEGVTTVWPLDGTQGVELPSLEAMMLVVLFSPDGERVLTSSANNLVAVWRLDGSHPVPLMGHSGLVRSAAFSPDGNLVLTASDDGTAGIWSLEPAGGPVPLRGHQKGVNWAGFSPAGDRIVTASNDGTARVWRVRTSSEPIEFRGHTENVLRVAFSADGKRLATAAIADAVRVWPTDGSFEPMVLEAIKGVPQALLLLDDGYRVASVSDEDENKTVHVWSQRGPGKSIDLQGHTDRVFYVAFSPNGELVASGSRDGTVRIWKADGTSNPVVIPLIGSIGGVWFSPDGGRLAIFSDGTLRVWPIDGAAPLQVVSGYMGSVATLRFTQTGCKVVMGSDEGKIEVWNEGRLGAPLVLQGHTEFITSAQFSPDGDRLATASWDKTIRVWTTDGSADPFVLPGHEGQTTDLDFSPQGDLLVSCGLDLTARLWSLSAERLRTAIRRSTAVTLEASFREKYFGESPPAGESNLERK